MPHPWERLGFPTIVLPPSALSSPEAAIRFLVGDLARAGHFRVEQTERVACQILHRESFGATAIGRGVAIPHSKSDVVEDVIGIVGCSAQGVIWPGAIDDDPVCVVCLLITPASKPGDCLRALELISRQLRGG